MKQTYQVQSKDEELRGWQERAQELNEEVARLKKSLSKIDDLEAEHTKVLQENQNLNKELMELLQAKVEWQNAANALKAAESDKEELAA